MEEKLQSLFVFGVEPHLIENLKIVQFYCGYEGRGTQTKASASFDTVVKCCPLVVFL